MLIVNPYHEQWKYLPMGTFGLCDFLNRQGIPSTIFNASLYGARAYLPVLFEHIRRRRPRHIGIIIHWKELLTSAIFISNRIKSAFPSITIVAGGFTAGFFAQELLARFQSIDVVIKGDAEQPLADLLAGRDIATIPNVTTRIRGVITANPSTYSINESTLDNISFANLNSVIDPDRYLRFLDRGLGFPIFIGRGCIFNCAFCGGSRRAFALHSNRFQAISRSRDAVLGDLRRLAPYTRKIYISYDTDRAYLVRLFRDISESDLAGIFLINLGVWRLMDDELLAGYRKATRCDSDNMPILELSPETVDSGSRRKVRDKALYYGDRAMLRGIHHILVQFNHHVIIRLYYSRYHSTDLDSRVLRRNLMACHKLYEAAFRLRNLGQVEVFYSHLATDVGSAYWDIAFRQSHCATHLELLLKALRDQRAGKAGSAGSPTDNLLIYVPNGLSSADIVEYERMIRVMSVMHHQYPFVYHIVSRLIAIDNLIQVLRQIVQAHSFDVTSTPRRADGTSALLEIVRDGVKAAGYYKKPGLEVFIDGLFALHQRCYAATVTGACSNDGKHQARPVFNPSKMYVTDYDYLSMNRYRRLRRGLAPAHKAKTLHIFCGGNVYSFDYSVYYPIFSMLNGNNTLADIDRKLSDSGFRSRKRTAMLSFIERNLRCIAL